MTRGPTTDAGPESHAGGNPPTGRGHSALFVAIVAALIASVIGGFFGLFSGGGIRLLEIAFDRKPRTEAVLSEAVKTTERGGQLQVFSLRNGGTAPERNVRISIALDRVTVPPRYVILSSEPPRTHGYTGKRIFIELDRLAPGAELAVLLMQPYGAASLEDIQVMSDAGLISPERIRFIRVQP